MGYTPRSFHVITGCRCESCNVIAAVPPAPAVLPSSTTTSASSGASSVVMARVSVMFEYRTRFRQDRYVVVVAERHVVVQLELDREAVALRPAAEMEAVDDHVEPVSRCRTACRRRCGRHLSCPPEGSPRGPVRVSPSRRARSGCRTAARSTRPVAHRCRFHLHCVRGVSLVVPERIALDRRGHLLGVERRSDSQPAP